MNIEKIREQGRKDVRNYRLRHPERVKEQEKRRTLILLKAQKENLILLKKEKGGKCTMCGCEEVRILHFHHLRDKKFELSQSYGKNLEKLREEADKCVLLCPNCHALIHLSNIHL